MLVKIYFSIWAVGILAAGVFYFTGNFSPIVQVAFGFLSFGMVFMGMMGVLPEVVVHDAAKKH